MVKNNKFLDDIVFIIVTEDFSGSWIVWANCLSLWDLKSADIAIFILNFWLIKQ